MFKYTLITTGFNGDLKQLYPVPGSQTSYSIYSDFIAYQFITNYALLTKLADDYNGNRLSISSLKTTKFRELTPLAQEFFLGDIVAIIIFMSYIVFCPLIVKRITDEKANKIKELLKMMGMSDWVFWTSHFIYYLMIVSIHSLFFTFLLCIGPQTILIGGGDAIFSGVDWYIFFTILMIFCVQTILFYMVFTTIFKSPVLAVIVTSIFYIISFVFVAKGLSAAYTDPDSNTWLRILSSMLPSAALDWDISLMYGFNTYGIHVGIQELFQSINYYNEITIAHIITVQILSCIFYIFLIWYLDSVWPFQDGIPKPIYFPCLPSYYCPHRRSDTSKDIETNASDKKNESFETEPTDIKKSIILKNISKVFAGNKGVHNLSLNIFNGQITALLGHNGAGKTTTMNMITGIYPPDSGQIFINGYNLESATNEARKSIGLCPQVCCL